VLKKTCVKNILTALAVTVLGFVLLNFTFLLDAGIQLLLNRIFGEEYHQGMQWIAPAKHIVFLAVIAFLTWLVLKSKWNRLFKAAFFMVPVAVVLVTAGMFLSRFTILFYGISVLLYGGVILYLFRTKRHWLYYYSATFVAASLLIMAILGMDI
jgi:hypothetical protein